jgi:hypothetical protein
MTFTYSGNPGASALDEVRFLIQDTDTSDQLLSNEEINYLLASYDGDAFGAAIAAMTSLIGQAARVQEESKTVGDLSLSVKSGARLQQWEMLLKRLQAERFRRFPGAPVVNANSLLSTVDRSVEDEGSDFVVGQMDNRT